MAFIAHFRQLAHSVYSVRLAHFVCLAYLMHLADLSSLLISCSDKYASAPSSPGLSSPGLSVTSSVTGELHQLDSGQQGSGADEEIPEVHCRYTSEFRVMVAAL